MLGLRRSDGQTRLLLPPGENLTPLAIGRHLEDRAAFTFRVVLRVALAVELPLFVVDMQPWLKYRLPSPSIAMPAASLRVSLFTVSLAQPETTVSLRSARPSPSLSVRTFTRPSYRTDDRPNHSPHYQYLSVPRAAASQSSQGRASRHAAPDDFAVSWLLRRHGVESCRIGKFPLGQTGCPAAYLYEGTDIDDLPPSSVRFRILRYSIVRLRQRRTNNCASTRL